MTDDPVQARPRRPRTIPLWPDAAQAVGVSRATAYDTLAPKGWLIDGLVPIWRVGGRWFVPEGPLLKALGLDDGDDLRSRCFAPSPGEAVS